MKKLFLVVLTSVLMFNLNGQNNNTLIRGQALKANSKLVSDNGDYYLLMQADGNLCIYGFDERIYWCTMSQNSKGGGELKLQEDGNLVVKNKENGAEWASKTHPYFDSKFQLLKGNKPTKLVLENNGTLALYNKKGKEVWSVNVGVQSKNTQTNNLSLKQNETSGNKDTQITESTLKINNESQNNFSSTDTIAVSTQSSRSETKNNGTETIYYNSFGKGCLESDAAIYRICTFDANGKPIGEIRDYFVTGELQAIVEGALIINKYDDRKSVFIGVCMAYNKDGSKQNEIIYSSKGEITAISFFKNGEPIKYETEKIFYNSKMQGCTESDAEFYRICALDTKGKPVGEIRDYFMTGELQALIEGALSIDKNDDSKSVFIGAGLIYNKAGSQESEYRYNSQGELIATKSFYENGNLKNILGYKDGKFEGRYITYFENGELQASMGYGVSNTGEFNTVKDTLSKKPSSKANNDFLKSNVASSDTIFVMIKNPRNGQMMNDESNAIHPDSIFPMYKEDSKTLFAGYAVFIQEYALFNVRRGDPATIGYVVNGVKEGLWTSHQYRMKADGTYIFGPKIEEVLYINGKKSRPDGLVTILINSSKKKSEGYYINGKKNGQWKYWYGRIIPFGKKQIYWLTSIKNYVNDKLESSIYYNWYGIKVNESNYSKFDSKKNYTTEELEYPHDYEGKQIEYFDNGKKYLETNYVNGKKEGISTKWYDSVYNSDGVLGINIPHNEQDHGYWPLSGTTHYKLTETNYVNGNKIFMHVFGKDGNIVKIENFD